MFRKANNRRLLVFRGSVHAALIGAALCLVSLGIPATARATVHKDLDEAMQRMADEIVQFVKNAPDAKGSVMIGSFDGPAIAAGGSAIVQALKEHLEGKVEIVDAGAYKVDGEFEGQKQPIDGQPRFVVLIEAVIRNRLGSKVQVLRERIVTDVSNEIALFGATVDLSEAGGKQDEAAAAEKKDDQEKTSANDGAAPITESEKPIQSEQEAADRVAESIVDPKVSVPEGSDSVAMISDKSPYGIELLVKEANGYVNCKLDQDALSEGLAKVAITPDQVYAVRIYNNTQRPVAVALTIDGINSFAFSLNPDWQQLGKWGILPGKSLIKGWHHDATTVHEFLVTRYGDSAAARFNATEGLGTVTATFFTAVPAKSGEASSPGLEHGTGLGEKAEMKITPRPLKFGNKPIGAVSIRYLRPTHPTDLPE